MKHVPNFITSLNLAAGFIAIIFALEGSLVTASWLILSATIFDFLDGFSAKLLKACSPLGKELDSLADIVSFGVAPAVIIYRLLCTVSDATINNTGGILQLVVILSPAIMPVCAGLRLAKFNNDETQKTSFKGLPTPANALAVISIIIAGEYSDAGLIKYLTGSAAALIIFTAVLSILMVTRIPLLSLKFVHLKLRGNEGRYLLAVLVLISFAIIGIGAAPLIIPLYIIVSLISLLFR
jgi:CDP-diacylglycerol--serine O-phosphatidyltransferase